MIMHTRAALIENASGSIDFRLIPQEATRSRARQTGWAVVAARTATAILVIASAPALAGTDPTTDGAAIFHARCAKCHGETGRTNTPDARMLKVRPLANDAELAAMEPAEIVRAIKESMKHTSMVYIQDLSNAQLESLAVFVRELAKQP